MTANITQWLTNPTGSYSTNTMNIYMPYATTFNWIRMYVFPTGNNVESKFHIYIRDGASHAYTSPTYTLTGTETGVVEIFDIPLEFTCSNAQTVYLQFVNEKNCATARVVIDNNNKWVIGTGGYSSVAWSFPLEMETELVEESHWTMNDEHGIPILTVMPYIEWEDWERKSNGKPYNTGVWWIHPTSKIVMISGMKLDNFMDWKRDKYNYPLNTAVWRIDSNNLGLPWLWGFAQRQISANLIVSEDGKLKFKTRNSPMGKLEFKIENN